MAKCIAVGKEGMPCPNHGFKKFDGTPAEGLCGRHHHLWYTGNPVVLHATGETMALPAQAR
ncbi:MAG: hypothetical protein ACRDHF_08690 [Tepidiformaceae bacterium]